MLSLRQRGYAIFKSLYFGILPSWFYEKHCHYSDNGVGMNIKTYFQHEAVNLAFQDGFDQGELNILRQFVQGKLDRDYILEMFGDKLGLGDVG